MFAKAPLVSAIAGNALALYQTSLSNDARLILAEPGRKINAVSG
jgi:hypothetical protein